ncbi:hypothetical protein DK26_15170 [Bosea sp. WAO]|nr:hypothetical protein DK26_15170 [Bosea sp. WAO]
MRGRPCTGPNNRLAACFEARFLRGTSCCFHRCKLIAILGAATEVLMNGIIYIIGLVVVVLAILSFLGLR